MKGVLQQDRLYIGTSEEIAKVAPIYGISSPVTLSEVYPALNCLLNFNKVRWGIISVNASRLKKDMYISSDFNLCENGEESLKEYGTCLYALDIKPEDIIKIAIYDRDNPTIERFVNEQKFIKTPDDHKNNYKRSEALLQWFIGGVCLPEHIINGSIDCKSLMEIGNKINNRSGVDIYYTN